MARPKKEIDQSLLEKLASIHCTIEEMAMIFECSRDTIERRFAAIIRKARATGKSSLRRLQWESAQKGNVAMQIWLGKQILDQAEKVEEKSEVTSTNKQEIIVYESQWAKPQEEE